MTKIAFGAKDWDDLASWYKDRELFRLTTRYLPKRHAEMLDGGSLFWILDHTLVARSSILGFPQAKDGRWHIEIEPRLVRVHPQPKRAHQGWRYLADENAPRDLSDSEDVSDIMPSSMVNDLSKLGLV